MDALAAPLQLGARSWKALLRPIIGIAIALLLPIMTHQVFAVGVGGWLYLLPFWMTVAWFAVEYQRQMLLGAEAAGASPGAWRQYGMYLLMMAVLIAVLAVLIGFLFSLVLPGIAFFMMAINSPQPWLALGTLVLWGLVPLVAAYTVLRLSLVLPALAVGHSPSPRRSWQITRGNGLRLLVLLVLLPGLVSAMIYLVAPMDSVGMAVRGAVAVLDVYLGFACLSVLAIAYRALSDEELPDTDPAVGSLLSSRFAGAMKTVALVLLLGVGVFAVWDGVYRVGVDENVFVTRFGRPERMESTPGIQLKMPFVEAAESKPKDSSYSVSGDAVFLTRDKKSLPLRYELRWRIVDPERFQRAVAGQTLHAGRRLEQVAHDTLRNELIRLSGLDLNLLHEAGKLTFSVDQKSPAIASLGGVIADVNSRVIELGISLDDLEVAVAELHR